MLTRGPFIRFKGLFHFLGHFNKIALACIVVNRMAVPSSFINYRFDVLRVERCQDLKRCKMGMILPRKRSLCLERHPHRIQENNIKQHVLLWPNDVMRKDLPEARCFLQTTEFYKQTSLLLNNEGHSKPWFLRQEMPFYFHSSTLSCKLEIYG